MRLAPVPIYYNNNLRDAINYSGESSKTTHGTEESVAGCHLLGSVLWHLLNGTGKHALLGQSTQAIADLGIKLPKKIADIAQGTFHTKLRNEIRGSGYVVDSLEAAAWCFIRPKPTAMPYSPLPTSATMPTPPQPSADRLPEPITAMIPFPRNGKSACTCMKRLSG